MTREDAGARRLRTLLEERDHVAAPGCATALEAMMAAETGNDAIYMSGAATNLVQYGWFDGRIGLAEMAENAKRLARATDLPVIADADTGYGGVHNVRRTIREYHRAGVAAVQLEDQRWPKRCGHAAGKEVVPRADAAAKIEAAVDVREAEDRDIMLVARTDAYGAANGDWEEHVARGRLFADLGADLIMPEMPGPSREDAFRYAAAVHETHPEARFLWNYSSNFDWHDQSEPLTFDELADHGYQVSIVSLFGLQTAALALHDRMAALARSGAPAQWRLEEDWAAHGFVDRASDLLFELGEFEAYQALEERYLDDTEARYRDSSGRGAE